MLWLSFALAVESGVVVTFSSGDLVVDEEVLVLLESEQGTIEVLLADDGEKPDVAALDGQWSGSVRTVASDFEVVVMVDGQEQGRGQASFPETGARDLRLAWSNEALSVQVSAPTDPGEGPQGSPEGGQPLDPSVGGTPISPGATGGATGPSSAPATLPSGGAEASSNSTLLIGLGLGLLVLAAIVMAWLRSGGGSGYRIKTRAELQDEPPLLGPGGPVLSQGLHRVQVEGDAASLIAALLPILARDHRVLVTGVEEVHPVWGGPVYRCTAEKAVHIGDAAEDLLDGPGLPLVVLALGGEGLDEQLPEGVGGLWLQVGPAQEGALRASQDEAGWLLGDHPVA